MNDSWIKTHSPIGAAEIHALGYINFRWNQCEFMFRALHGKFVGKTFDEGWAKSEGKRPSEIISDLDKAIKSSAFPPDVREMFLYAIDLLEICRANRNRYSHFIANGTMNGLELRRSKAPSYSAIFEGDPIDITLECLRRIADEIDATAQFVRGMVNVKLAGAHRFLFSPPPPLPERPPLPEILTTVRPADRSKAQPQPYRRRSSLP
jgi:hypothetical protein